MYVLKPPAWRACARPWSQDCFSARRLICVLKTLRTRGLTRLARSSTRAVRVRKEKKKVSHLGLAVAAINALAAGEKRNATPFTWRLRPPPPDANGLSFPEGAPLEIVDFFSVAKCVPSGGVPPQRGFHNSGYGVRSKGLEV